MSAELPSDRPTSVLVVDDDTVSRLVLAHMLRRLGYDVVEADDVAPAVELAAESEFQVVISDYAMPGGTGLHLLAQLPTAQRPAFILVTGIAPDAVNGATDPATAGAQRFDVPAGRTIDGYLTKPVSTRAVRGCLRDVLATQDH